MSPLRFVLGMIPVCLLGLSAGAVCGQDYPNKPIRIITGSAGGGNDFVSRLIAQGISSALGQPVVVDNRPGAVLSIEAVAKSPPDGYALLVHGATVWITPLLQRATYDAVNDYSPISLVSREVLIVAVHPSVPARSVKELIALAKTKPGELNYSASSLGGPPHLTAELLKSMAGVNIVHVPYKGTVAAITALITGEVQLTITDAGLITPHVKSGRLRALAVTGAQPSALAPGLPTVTASGVPGYEAGSMTGIWAPGRTPAAIVDRLNVEIVRFLNRPEVKERFLNTGAEVVASSPAQFAATIKSDIAKWSKVIRDAGIKVPE